MSSHNSNISSHHFMKNAITNNSPPSSRPSSSSGFFIKGSPTTPSNNIVRIPPTPNHIETNTINSSLQFHRDSIRDSLQKLKLHSNTYLVELDQENTLLLGSIQEILRSLYGTKVLYDLVLSDIREYFSDVVNIKPGTVASFFVGCFNDTTFTGPIGCSPKCVASLPPTEGTPGYYNCEDLVLIYSNSSFNSFNDKISSHAYIHIEDPSFTGFTESNIKQLRDTGIDRVSLAYTNPDGSYREVTSPLPLDKAPLITSKSVVESSSTPPTSSGAGWVILIILIVLLIVGLIFAYQKYYA